MPASTAASVMVRCSNSTSMRARVPSRSPSSLPGQVPEALVGRGEGAGCAGHATRALAPARAPGLMDEHLEVVVEFERLGPLARRSGVTGHDAGPVEGRDMCQPRGARRGGVRR